MSDLSYAIGRIRAMEVYLIDHDQMMRAASSRDLASAFPVLSEKRVWSEYMQKLENAFDIPGLLGRAQAGLIGLMQELCPKEPEISAMMSLYNERLTEGEYLGTLEKSAARSSSSMFRKMVSVRKVFSSVKYSLFDGTRKPDEIIASYNFSDLAAPIARGVEEFKRTGELDVLDKESDDALMKAVRPAKYAAFGVDPVIGFLVAKQTEIKNLGLILGAKRLGIPFEAMRKRMRMSYA